MAWLETKILPPLVMVICGALMWGIALITPSLPEMATWTNILSKALVASGFLILFIAAFYFFKVKTTINPMVPKRSSSLVTSGLYRYSRNPIYVADIVFLLAWAFYLNNPISLVGIVGFVLYMNRFQIEPEERALEANFGQDYLDFKARVRRWI